MDDGTIEESFSASNVVLQGRPDNSANGPFFIGGLIGQLDEGRVINSYTVAGKITTKDVPLSYVTDIGGLIGNASNSATQAIQVDHCYSAGVIGAHLRTDGRTGGFVGVTSTGRYKDNFWDSSTTGATTDAGINGGEVPTATAYTSEQLQAGLPPGFSPAIWASSPAINGGLPYLRNGPN